eukprot:9103969-Pyramimonas_sp.AAC.1
MNRAKLPSTASQHHVRGSGNDVPGLLGQDELILPGCSDIQIEWPGGTVRTPLQKAPSGGWTLRD